MSEEQEQSPEDAFKKQQQEAAFQAWRADPYTQRFFRAIGHESNHAVNQILALDATATDAARVEAIAKAKTLIAVVNASSAFIEKANEIFSKMRGAEAA